MAWTELAACAPHRRPEGMTQAAWTALFFPTRGQSVKAALAVCESCPVADRCREEALQRPRETQGIWGGLSERQRRRIGSKRGPQPVVVRHGTTAGYQAHRRAGDKPCQVCAWAHREDMRRRRGLEVAS